MKEIIVLLLVFIGNKKQRNEWIELGLILLTTITKSLLRTMLQIFLTFLFESSNGLTHLHLPNFRVPDRQNTKLY
jgi:hypothetical protein